MGMIHVCRGWQAAVENGQRYREALERARGSCDNDMEPDEEKKWCHGIRMRTGISFTPLPMKMVEELACDELYFKVHVKTGEEEYECDRAGHHTCYGKGWCPLRFTAPWYTPRIDPKDGHWRYY